MGYNLIIMRARSSIRKIGNSRGIIIPAEAMGAIGLSEGDAVDIITDADRLMIVPSGAHDRNSFIAAMEEIISEDEGILRELAK